MTTRHAHAAEPDRRRPRPWGDPLFRGLTAAAAVLFLALAAAILLELVNGSTLSLAKFGPSFLWSSAWNPVTGDFGALSSIAGTLITTAIAMALAVPMSLVIALFLVELAPPAVSKPVGAAIELLAAVPSIIYGMWGLFVFVPFMSDHVQPFLSAHLGFLPLFKGPPMGIGLLTAGIILALMILPFITSVMRDVLRMVPPVVKEAGYGMGSTVWEVARKVTVRYGVRGMVGACLLGLGRAVGETMAVTFVIGNNHRVGTSLFDAGNSIASALANEFAEAADPLYLSALVELGLVLFLMTFAIQGLTHVWIRHLERSAGRGL
ncbi:MAG: phosphate ABC transporter permease subunit PstC [Candidatus Latescibacteria bacterium]|nr:phosphate ABC transporter permease subunit PstC [Candidatus Latescibacterota bacterium]